MVSEDSTPTSEEKLTPEEARRCLLRLIARRDMAEHEAIYEELARE